MLLARYKQQPGERLKRIIDLTTWLESTEEIEDVVVKSITPETTSPFQCTSVVIDPDGKKFAYYLTGGEDGETYKVEFTISTQTQIREDEIEVDVEEL
jgi:hypothetical protein